MSDRVHAEFARLDHYVATVAGMGETWAPVVTSCETALTEFFSSVNDFGPTSSSIPTDARALTGDYQLMALGVAATSEAFRQIDEMMRYDDLGGIVVSDEGVEALRRAWLDQNFPDVAALLAESQTDPRELLAELEDLNNEIEHFWDGANMWAGPGHYAAAEAQYEKLLEERANLANEAIIHIEQINQEILESRADGRNPTWKMQLRDDLVSAVANNDDLAQIVVAILDAGAPAVNAFVEAEATYNYEARIDAVMIERDVSDEEAMMIIAEIDQITIELMGMGHDPQSATMAGVLGELHGLDAATIHEIALMFQTNAADAAAIHVMATERDMTPAQFGNYTNLNVHFSTIARDGDSDSPVITWDDLDYIRNNPDEFDLVVVETVNAIFEDPSVFFRLDDAATNNDILDKDYFGSDEASDWKIGYHEFAAFELKQHINNYLGEWSIDIDTAHKGGDPDQYFSGGDYRHFLDNLPPELADDDHAKELLTQIIDGQMYDQGWFEEHFDELVMLAAVVAGVGAFFLTGGAAAPLLLTLVAGFAAGATTAGVLTLGGNHAFGKDLTDGLAANMLRGGFGGMAGAALPLSITGLTGATGGYSTTVAALGLGSDVTGIIAMGGTDIVIPEDWESGVHDVTGKLSLATGVGALTMVGGRLVFRAFPQGSPLYPGKSVLTDLGGHLYESPSGLKFGLGSDHATRVAHLEAHMVDNPMRLTRSGKPSAHGVFTTDNAFSTVDEAWAKIQANSADVLAQPQGNRTAYYVAMGDTVGYTGGPVGQALGNPRTQWVKVIVEGDEFITAFPVDANLVVTAGGRANVTGLTPNSTALTQAVDDAAANTANKIAEASAVAGSVAGASSGAYQLEVGVPQ